MEKDMRMNVVTHDDKFHPDEVFACALIKRGLECRVIRTRDNEVANKADFVIDVGGIHDPEMGRYDHHHFTTAHPKYGMSAAGLLYETMGLTSPWLDALIEHVDSRDTRVNYNPDNPFDVICELLIGLNHIDTMGPEQDGQFMKAVDYAITYINAIIPFESGEMVLIDPIPKGLAVEVAANERSKEEEYARRALSTTTDGLVTYGKYYPTWHKDIEDGLFVTPGDAPGQYKVMVNTDYLKIKHISDEVFVHAGGFFGVFAPTFFSECMVTVEESDGLVDIHFDLNDLRKGL